MSDLILYHGGRTEPVCRAIPAGQIDEQIQKAATLTKVPVSDADLSTVYRWGDGGLTPLSGPMDSATFNRVFDEAVLEYEGKICVDDSALLTCYRRTCENVESWARSRPDEQLTKLSPRSKSPTSSRGQAPLPQVRLLDRPHRSPWRRYGSVGDADKTYLLGGTISVFPQKKNPAFGKYVLSPKEVRALIAERGWDRVVAFQTRNPLHRAHEYALVYGLEKLLKEGHNAGACLNPLVGETKGDDVNAEIRMQTYEKLIDDRALGEGDSDVELWKKLGEEVPDRVVLLGLDIKMFYGGPKEAVMHAIYRQNFGFTDVVIGRKHADAPYKDGTAIWGDFDAQEIFNNLNGDLQEKPLKVGFAAYYESVGRVDLMEFHPDEKPVFISGKDVRATLQRGEQVDPRIMRPSTSAILAATMKQG